MSRTYLSPLWTKLQPSNGYLLDLIAGLAYLVLGTLIVLLWPEGSLGRILVGVPLALFVPGYSIVAALFPGSRKRRGGRHGGTVRTAGPISGGLDVYERVALSFGVSLATLPVVGLATAFLGFGLASRPIAIGLLVISGISLGIAAVRRERLPAERRFRLPVDRWWQLQEARIGSSSSLSALLDLLLVASVVLSLTTLGYGLAVPNAGDSYTEFGLLTTNDSGEYVADGYPENVSLGEPHTLSFRVQNQEGERTNYTVVAQLQRVERSGETLDVRERRKLARFQRTLEPHESWYATHEFRPNVKGDDLRLVYLLYRGTPTSDPSIGSAYRHTYLSVNVQPTNESEAGDPGGRTD